MPITGASNRKVFSAPRWKTVSLPSGSMSIALPVVLPNRKPVGEPSGSLP